MTEYSTRQRGIYRSRDGVIFGVCQGLANHFDFPVFWVRMMLVFMFIFTGFWPVIGVYLIAAFMMKPEPVRPIATDDGRGHRPGIRVEKALRGEVSHFPLHFFNELPGEEAQAICPRHRWPLIIPHAPVWECGFGRSRVPFRSEPRICPNSSGYPGRFHAPSNAVKCSGESFGTLERGDDQRFGIGIYQNRDVPKIFLIEVSPGPKSLL